MRLAGMIARAGALGSTGHRSQLFGLVGGQPRRTVPVGAYHRVTGQTLSSTLAPLRTRCVPIRHGSVLERVPSTRTGLRAQSPAHFAERQREGEVVVREPLISDIGSFVLTEKENPQATPHGSSVGARLVDHRDGALEQSADVGRSL
jgi:hypothetical protein